MKRKREGHKVTPHFQEHLIERKYIHASPPILPERDGYQKIKGEVDKFRDRRRER